MFGKVWAVSSNLKVTVTLWNISGNRFVRPHEERPPKEVKVVGRNRSLRYKGTELNCDVYEGDVKCDIVDYVDVPQDVLDYSDYYIKSSVILAKIKERADEVVQEFRGVHETPEDSEESDSGTGIPETGDQQG